MLPQIFTVRDHISWSYANLARVQVALMDGVVKFERVHHAIRMKMWKGLQTQSLKMGSLYDDERLKMTMPQACSYCGSRKHLTVDHLIPRIQGGGDQSDNLIWACRSCNSSKQGKDMLEWMILKDSFPPILLLRRYIKIVTCYCESENLMDLDLTLVDKMDLPFNLELLPYKFPPLSNLRLWIVET